MKRMKILEKVKEGKGCRRERWEGRCNIERETPRDISHLNKKLQREDGWGCGLDRGLRYTRLWGPNNQEKVSEQRELERDSIKGTLALH